MSIGFGIEKLGSFAVRFPRTVVAAIVLSLPLFLAAAAQLTFSSDIRDLFRSSENAFATLDALESHFPASAHDLQLVIGNGDLLSAEGIRVLHKLDAALKALNGVQGVTSIFSVPARPGADGANSGSGTGGTTSAGTAEVLVDLNSLRRSAPSIPLAYMWKPQSNWRGLQHAGTG